MTKYYSASTGGFYSTEIHGTNMPADVTSIPEEEWLSLLQLQSSGLRIVSDENGRPVPTSQTMEDSAHE